MERNEQYILASTNWS